ncbi:D-lysine 5,6-aminomutase beta subunit [Candidatus Izimaplasma bacterium HR1]|jgi:beta-lysine 5,6-aminomutase beta subunit|uniref:lysine 5,6-aminomutase subunit beta n=1 Tax=Candidatus Izimoplasma sp. HR1 TaxID=1541959 RepID=UPI0004F8162D|nr:D-lysine 5,6-aminomutase beta subunit [Candidatus Izimaplasma bacterium HR1]
MGYDLNAKNYSKELDLKRLKPYGDTMNDGKIQLSFTLPIKNDEKGAESAKVLARKMGINDPLVAESITLDNEFTMYIVYGGVNHTIDYTTIEVETVDTDVMSKYEVEDFIEQNFDNNIVVVGASTGTDAHTVGIDAIMNMKGFAGHYGLERYRNIDAYNLGSQVENELLIKKALDVNADVLLVSQTVTQKDVHIKNLVNLVELLEAEGLRERFLIIVGGPRITHELAKELGFDAGFGPKKFAEDVASFFAQELHNRKSA